MSAARSRQPEGLAGMRMTATRRELLQLLQELDAPQDAITLYRDLQPRINRPFALGTVYRMLREFEQRRLVVAIVGHDGRLLWRLCPVPSAAGDDAAPVSEWLQAVAAELGCRLVRA
ncbi:transcriptional repressor [Xanthomonas sp. XNM01]|uniref:transcriptional repressor n=1 Tax=Xanthomonas sp. XNM01 TaxID=2769289 RepID=UPI0017805559|nr:transcriptional repressor [Xanthomonas sp. XNM01]MBD9370968.1 transcriptional repressor [Xanthomonas sp. XNM01]